MLVVRSFDEVFVGVVVISAFSCRGCLAALCSLGDALGLGFLGQYEGVMINKLLPIFAGFLLVINMYSWSKHRVHWRGTLSIIPPVAVLATLYPLWKYGWSTYLFYAALTMMVAVSISGVIWPTQTFCETKAAV